MLAIAVPVLNERRYFNALLAFHGRLIWLSIESAIEHLPALQQAAGELAAIIE